MKRVLFHASVLIGLGALLMHIQSRTAIDWSTASAAESTYGLAVSCVDPVILAFASDMSYTITIPSGNQSAPISIPSIGITGTLATPVNGDGSPSISSEAALSGQYLRFYHNGPYIKIGGVQCSDTSSASLVVHGDGADDPNYNIALQESSSTSWQDSRQVDQLSSGNPTTLYGNSGTLGNAVSDGSDADGIVNGEIAFGGSGNGAAYRLFNSFRILGGGNTNRSETITYIFTPQ